MGRAALRISRRSIAGGTGPGLSVGGAEQGGLPADRKNTVTFRRY
jgi:hypothetical protein